jgi:hypothetical protein
MDAEEAMVAAAEAGNGVKTGPVAAARCVAVAVVPYFLLSLCLFFASAYCHSATHMIVIWMPC